MTTLEILLNLLKFREIMLFNKWQTDLKTLSQQGKSRYQILMRETSDVMQDLALAFGERQTMQYCIDTLATMKNTTNKAVMTSVFRLFGAEIVNRDLSWYILQGAVGKQATKNLTDTRMSLIAEVAGQSDNLLDCLSIPKEQLLAPISGDYVKYNASPNYGEIIGAKL